MKKNILGFTLMVLLLTGCLIQTSKLGSVEKFDEVEFGYVAATLVSKQMTNEKNLLLPIPPKIVANFQGNTSTSNLEFQLHTIGTNWKDSAAKGEDYGTEYRLMLLVPVKPGNYWLDNVEASFYGGYRIDTELRARYPTVLVRKGEITYLGSIQVISNIGKNVVGEVRPGKISLNINNEFQKDIDAMRIFDSKINKMTLRNGLE
jgi:hypothetical protein